MRVPLTAAPDCIRRRFRYDLFYGRLHVLRPGTVEQRVPHDPGKERLADLPPCAENAVGGGLVATPDGHVPPMHEPPRRGSIVRHSQARRTVGESGISQ